MYGVIQHGIRLFFSLSMHARSIQHHPPDIRTRKGSPRFLGSPERMSDYCFCFLHYLAFYDIDHWSSTYFATWTFGLGLLFFTYPARNLGLGLTFCLWNRSHIVYLFFFSWFVLFTLDTSIFLFLSVLSFDSLSVGICILRTLYYIYYTVPWMGIGASSSFGQVLCAFLIECLGNWQDG